MEVASQFSQIPASKIIYITPKRTVSQQNLKNVKGILNTAETVRNPVHGLDSGDIGRIEPNTIFEVPLQKNTTEYEKAVNMSGMTPNIVLETREASLEGHTGAAPQKPAAATQTVLVSQTGSTILDEMKKKAGEALRKLNIYQSNMAAQEPEQKEKKSVLLPGTDSEYRTPGAHYRNKNGQIKRPMNAFMVWAREFRGKLAAAMPNATNSDISIKLGQVWSSLPPEQKRQYYNIAEKIKLKHRQDFPDWVYKPVQTIKKKDNFQTEECSPISEIVASSSQRNIMPYFPFVKLASDVNNNQSATTTGTRIPVILQPVTYHPGPPADEKTVKEKLADKIYGGVQNATNVPNVPQLTARPINTSQNLGTPVRIIEPSLPGLQRIAPRPGQIIRPVSGKKEQTMLGQLLTATTTEMDIKAPISNAETVSTIDKTILVKPKTQQATNSTATVVDNAPVYKPPEANQEARAIPRDHNNAPAELAKPENHRIHQQMNEPTSIKPRIGEITSTSSQMVQREKITGGSYLPCHKITDPQPVSDHKPMYLELLDPFDPLMDCDFLYSELYPGCLHLDVARWREYLDISSDDENDPLSRFQDDSDDDIKISPVPLKESLRRLCNANVQRSASGDVITCDIMVPVSTSDYQDGDRNKKNNV